MDARIAIDCLSCGHFVTMDPTDLAGYGLNADASLVTPTKKLVCKECGSKAVRAYRFVEDTDGPTLVPR